MHPHARGILHIWVVRDGLERAIEHAGVDPIAISLEDRVPAAERRWQIMLFTNTTPQSLSRLRAAAEAGVIRPRVGSRYPLADVGTPLGQRIAGSGKREDRDRREQRPGRLNIRSSTTTPAPHRWCSATASGSIDKRRELFRWLKAATTAEPVGRTSLPHKWSGPADGGLPAARWHRLLRFAQLCRRGS